MIVSGFADFIPCQPARFPLPFALRMADALARAKAYPQSLNCLDVTRETGLKCLIASCYGKHIVESLPEGS